MRILHLDTGRDMRGGQWQVLRLAERLAPVKVESTILARGDGELLTLARQRGLRVAPITLWRIAMLAAGHDVIHAHDARAHTLALMAGFTPLVVSRRVAFPIRTSIKYWGADRVLAVSEFVKKTLLKGGVPEKKIRVVYDGVMLGGESVGSLVIAPPGASDRMKGGNLVQEAAKLAGVEIKVSTSLERDVLNSRLLVYITQSEGLGSAALLAMAAGVPVIASRVGGLPEIIQHGENGLLVENNVAEIADAIRRLENDPELAQRIGRAARQTVKDQFSIEQMVANTVAAYRQVIN